MLPAVGAAGLRWGAVGVRAVEPTHPWRGLEERGGAAPGGPPALSPAHALTPARPPAPSSIMNVPGESTLRREFLRLQQENKSNSEALKQQLQQQQQRDPEAHIKHLLHQRQRRIEEQKEERRRVEEVGRPPGGGGGLRGPQTCAQRRAAPAGPACGVSAARRVDAFRTDRLVLPLAARSLRPVRPAGPRVSARTAASWAEAPSKDPPVLLGCLGFDLLESSLVTWTLEVVGAIPFN